MRGEMLQHYEEPKKAEESEKAAEFFKDFTSAKDELEFLILQSTGEPLSEERNKSIQNEMHKAERRLQKAEDCMMRDKEGRARLADKLLSLLSSFKFDDAKKLFYRLSLGAREKITALPEVQSCAKETAMTILLMSPNEWYKAKFILDTFIPSDKERDLFKQETETQLAVKKVAAQCLAGGAAKRFNEIVQYFILEPSFAKEAIEEVYYYFLSQGKPRDAFNLARWRVAEVNGQYVIGDHDPLKDETIDIRWSWGLTEKPETKQSAHEGAKLALLEKRWGDAQTLLDTPEFFSEAERSDMLKQSLIHHLHKGDMPSVANVTNLERRDQLESLLNDREVEAAALRALSEFLYSSIALGSAKQLLELFPFLGYDREDTNTILAHIFIKRVNEDDIHFFNEFSQNYPLGAHELIRVFAKNPDLQAAVVQKLSERVEMGKWDSLRNSDFCSFASFFILEDNIGSFIKENQVLQESLKRRIIRELQSLQEGRVQNLENLVSYYSDHQALFNMEDVQTAARETSRSFIECGNLSVVPKLANIIPVITTKSLFETPEQKYAIIKDYLTSLFKRGAFFDEVRGVIDNYGALEEFERLKNDPDILAALETGALALLSADNDAQRAAPHDMADNFLCIVFSKEQAAEFMQKPSIQSAARAAILRFLKTGEGHRVFAYADYFLKDQAAKNQLTAMAEFAEALEEGVYACLKRRSIGDWGELLIRYTDTSKAVDENSIGYKAIVRYLEESAQNIRSFDFDILRQAIEWFGYINASFITQTEKAQSAAKNALSASLNEHLLNHARELVEIFFKGKGAEDLTKDAAILSAAKSCFVYFFTEGKNQDRADLMSILRFDANEEREFTAERICEYLTEGMPEESKIPLSEAIRGEKKVIETCLKYPNEKIDTGYTIQHNVAGTIRDALLDSRNPKDVSRRIEEFEQNPYSVFRFVHDEQVNTLERTPFPKPEINEQDILNDMAVFAEYTALFNDQKLNLPPDLMKQILGQELFNQVNDIQTRAKEFIPDLIERDAAFHLIDFQSALNDAQTNSKNAYALVFHGTTKETAEAVTTRSALEVKDRAYTGTYVSSRSSISFEQYAMARDAVSGAKQGTQGGLVIYPREALRGSHVEGVRQHLNSANGYIVDAEGRFTRIPFSAGINVSADNRVNAETNVCRAIFIIQKAKEMNILNGIKEKFAAFLKDQGLHLEEMYRLMRSKNYPEEKIVEARDSYARYALQRRASAPQAHEKFTVCQKVLDSYNDQDGVPAIKAKADISMIMDLMEEYPEAVPSSEDIQEKSADEIEGAIQKKIRKLQRRKFLESLREGRKQGGFYARFKERLGTLHKAGYEHLMRLTPSKLSHLACGEINGEKLAETHASIQEIERELAEMLKYTLRSSVPPALERLRSESATLQELLEQRKDRWSVALTGSGGRGIPSMTSDLDFVLYLNDEHLTDDEKAGLRDALFNLKTHIVSVLQETGGVAVDAAQMNVQPTVTLSNVKQLVLEDASRQAVEPVSVLESQPVDKDISFMLPFQKALIEKRSEVSGFLQKELKTEKFFRWMYSTSELWSGDSIKDFKKDIMRTVEWVFMCVLLTRVLPDQIAEPIPAEMLKKIQWAREKAILTEEETSLFNQLITDIARWKLRGDIISQNSKDVPFDSMMLTNKERQRFVEYANFINGLVTEDIKEKMKEEIIIN